MAVIERIPMLQYKPAPAREEEVTLKQRELERLIDVSPMTIYLWRKAEEDPLPCRTIPTGGGGVRVLFVYGEVMEWLGRNRPQKMKLLRRIGGISNGGYDAADGTGRDSALGTAREAA